MRKLRPLYTVKELAALAGVSKQRMYRLLDAYGVEYLHAGGRCRLVPLSELREKMWPLVDSFKLYDITQEIIGADDRN